MAETGSGSGLDLEGAFEDLFGEQAAATTPEPAAPALDLEGAFDDFQAGRQSDDDARLTSLLSLDSGAPVDKQADILRLSRELGVDPSFVEENHADWQKVAAESGRNAQALRERHPRFASMLLGLQPREALVVVKEEGWVASTFRRLAEAGGLVLGAAFGSPTDTGNVSVPGALDGVTELYPGARQAREDAQDAEVRRVAGEVTGPRKTRELVVDEEASALTGPTAPFRRAAASFRDSKRGVETSLLGAELLHMKMVGGDTFELEKQIARLEKDAAPKFYGQGALEQPLLDLTEIASSQLATLAAGGTAAAVGAAVGAVPGVLARNPAAARAGAKVGWGLLLKAGTAASSFSMESGGAYLEFRKEKLDDGTPMSDDVAVGAAVAYGVVASVIETEALSTFLPMFGSLGDAVKAGTGRKLFRELLRDNPGFRAAVRDAGKRWLKGSAGEAKEEALQSIAQDLAEWGGKSLQAGEAQKLDVVGTAAKAGEAAAVAFSGTGLMGAPRAAHATRRAVSQHRADVVAGQQVAVLSGLAAEQSPTVRAAPQVVAQMVALETQRTGEAVTHVYVDPASFQELFQDELGGTSGADAAAVELLGESGPQQVQEALATGGRIEVPVADYLLKWGSKQVGRALERDTTASKEGVSLRELSVAEALVAVTTTAPGLTLPKQVEPKLLAKIDADARELAARYEAEPAIIEDEVEARFYGALVDQMVREGTHSLAEARRVAQLPRAFVRTMAERFGVPVADLFADYTLEIRARKAAPPRGGPAVKRPVLEPVAVPDVASAQAPAGPVDVEADAGAESTPAPQDDDGNAQGIADARAAVGRMKDPAKKALAGAWIDFASGMTDVRPQGMTDALEKQLAHYGVVDPAGFHFDEGGRSTARAISGRRSHGEEPAELRRIRLSNQAMRLGEETTWDTFNQEAPRTDAAPVLEADYRLAVEEGRAVGLHYRDPTTGLLHDRAVRDLPVDPERPLFGAVTFAFKKTINDRLGHEALNSVFRAIGNALHGREPLAAKIGGDLWLPAVRDQADLDGILEAARAELRETLPAELADLPLFGVVAPRVEGEDWVATRHRVGDVLGTTAETLRGQKLFPQRAEDPAALPLEIPDVAPAEAAIPAALEQRFESLSEREAATDIYTEGDADGSLAVLTKAGWDAVRRDAPREFVFSADVRAVATMDKTLGHESTDELINRIRRYFAVNGGDRFDAAHVSGDEFMFQADSLEEGRAWLEKAKADLAGVPLDILVPGSGIFRQEGLHFAYGEGHGFGKEAEHHADAIALPAAKAADAERGLTKEHYASLTRPLSLGELRAALAALGANPRPGVHAPAGEGASGGGDRAAGGARGQHLGGLSDFAPDGVARELEQPAFHGSPHRFDRFSLDAIGTGEGAQAFGWGVYFAQNREIAEFYRGKLTPLAEPTVDGEPLGDSGDGHPLLSPAEWLAFRYVSDAMDDNDRTVDEALAHVRGMLEARGGEHAVDVLATLEGLDLSRLVVNQHRGQLFAAEVPNSDRLLDWDAPMLEQPDAVRRALGVEGANVTYEEVEPLPRQDARHAASNGWEVRQKGETFEVFDPRGGFMGSKRSLDAAKEHISRLSGANTGGDGKHAYALLVEQLGSPRAASEHLRSLGIPGLRYLDGSSRDEGDGLRNFVIWDEAEIRDIQTFLQDDDAPGATNPRGSIQIGSSEQGRRAFRILLNPSADMSTVLHEFGHFFLEVFGDLAQRPDAPEDVKADWAATLEHLGVTDRAGIQRAEHEVFARGFEAYLWEGKAPSASLAAAFQRFKTWLRDIYRQVRQLDSPLSDEIRSVFDRLLASDEATQKAREKSGAMPLFRSPDDAGMSPEVWQAYSVAAERGASMAQLRVERVALEDAKRELEAWWKDELRGEREAAAKAFAELPGIRAWRYLRTGQAWWTEGDDSPAEVHRLDRDAVVRLVGKDKAKALAPVSRASGGVHPDDVAVLLGFPSGAPMLEAILSRPAEREWVAAEADRRMGERHPDKLRELGRLEEAAQEALHAEPTREWLLREWAILRRRDGQDGPPPVEAIQRAAKLLAEGRTLRDVAPSRALAAERAAARRAAEAAAKQEWGRAYAAKQQQILNHYLWRELVDAKRERERFEDTLDDSSGSRRRGELGKADAEHVLRDFSDGLLAWLGVRPMDAGARVPAMSQLLELLGTMGVAPAFNPGSLERLMAGEPLVPTGSRITLDHHRAEEVLSRLYGPEVARRSRNRKGAITLSGMEDALREVLPRGRGAEAVREVRRELRAVGAVQEVQGVGDSWVSLTVAEMREVDAALRQLAKTATDANTVILEGRRVALDTLAEEIAADAEALPRRPQPPADESAPAAGWWLSQAWEGVNSAMMDPEEILRRLGRTAHEFFWGGYLKAREAERVMSREVLGFFAQAWDALPKAMQAARYDVVDASALPLPEDVNRAGDRTREWAWMVALNMGNQSNKDRLLGGYGWQEADVVAFLENTLSPEEWGFIQGVFDLLDGKLYAEVAAVHERTSGVKPGKIQATRIGPIAGGYFPARYDPIASRLGAKQAEASAANLYSDTATRASVARSFTKERAEVFEDVINLQWSSVPSHLGQVIHYVTHAEFVREAARALFHPQVGTAIQRGLGLTHQAQLEGWLKVVATARMESVAQGLEAVAKGLGTLRTRFVTATLGWSISNTLGDLTNPFVAWASGDISGRHLSAGIASLVASPIATYRAAGEASPELRARRESSTSILQRELGEIGRTGNRNRAGRLLDATRRTAFFMQEAFDGLTSTIVWQGAYRQALARGDAHSAAVVDADRIVRGIFPGNALAEQPAILRDKRGTGALLSFFSYFSKIQNRIAREWHGPLADWALASDAGGKAGAAKDIAKAAGRTLAIFIITGTIAELLSGRGPDDDEEPEEWFLRKTLSAPFGMVPLFGWMGETAVGAGVSKAFHGESRERKLSARAAPVIATLERVGKAIEKAANSDEDDATAFALLEATLAFMGVPTNQPMRTGRYISDLATGTASPENAADLASGLVYGERNRQPANPLSLAGDAIEGR